MAKNFFGASNFSGGRGLGAAVIAVAAVLLGGCENKTQEGALIGAGIGTVAGAIIGSQVAGDGNRTEGAIVGGAIGAGAGGVTGGVIGNQQDRNRRND